MYVRTSAVATVLQVASAAEVAALPLLLPPPSSSSSQPLCCSLARFLLCCYFVLCEGVNEGENERLIKITNRDCLLLSLLDDCDTRK